jgi:hypothetical protein
MEHGGALMGEGTHEQRHPDSMGKTRIHHSVSLSGRQSCRWCHHPGEAPCGSGPHGLLIEVDLERLPPSSLSTEANGESPRPPWVNLSFIVLSIGYQPATGYSGSNAMLPWGMDSD